MAPSPPSAIPVLLGPTASGKTSVGIALAQRLNGEIISVDSRKVYRGLRVGTATPAGFWRDRAYVVDGVPHHLMDFLDLNRRYTAGDFARDADRLIGEIQGRGRVPILVGGTGFYFNALSRGLPAVPPGDEAIRRELEEKAKRAGWPSLHDELTRIDPDAGAAVSPNDRYKILRALEIWNATGRPPSEWKRTRSRPPPHRFAVMALDMPKETLERRIRERSARMIEEGMVDETARALKDGYAETCPALSGFGYREATDVVAGRLAPDAFLPALIKGTIAYGKRQKTWLRTQTKPVWFPVSAASTRDSIALKMNDFLYSEAL